MTPSRQRSRHLFFVMATAVITVLACAAPALGNALKPGVNEEIGFSSFRDFPEFGGPQSAGVADLCGEDDNPDDGFFYDLIGFPRCGEELYTMQPDGSGETRETDNTRLDGKFSWNPVPGGGWAYESNTDCQDYEEFMEDFDDLCLQDLYKVDDNGNNRVRLTSHPARDVHPSWSPSGTHMVFESGRPLLDEVIGWEPDIETEEPHGIAIPIRGVYTMLSSGEGPTPTAAQFSRIRNEDVPAGTVRIYSDLTPVHSPDGLTIAFTRLQIDLVGFVVVPPGGGIVDKVRELVEPDGQLKLKSAHALLRETSGLSGIRFSFQTYVGPSDNSSPSEPLGGVDECVIGFGSGGAGLDEDFECNIDRHPAYTADNSKIIVDRISSDQPTITRLIEAPSLDGFIDEGPPVDRDLVSIDFANPSQQTNLSDASGEDPECNLRNGTGPGVIETCDEDAKPAPAPNGAGLAFHSDRECVGKLEGLRNSVIGSLLNFPSPCFDIYTMNSDGSGVAKLTGPSSSDELDLLADWNADWRRSDPPVVVTAAPPPPAAAPTAPAAKTFARPSARVAGVRSRGCTASARLRVPIRVSAEAGVRTVRVSLDGRRIKTTKKSRFTVFVNARKLRSGRHRLSVTVIDNAGQRRTTTRRFSRCAQAKPRRRAAPRFTG